MDEEKKRGYIAGLISLFFGVIVVVITYDLFTKSGWNVTSQITTIFGGFFTILGIGSLLKPEVIGAITAQLLDNIARNADEESDSHRQVQSGTDRSAQVYTERGDVNIEQHFHGDEEKKKDKDSE